MALFGKKTSDGAATEKAPPSSDKKAGAKAGGLGFGRKKKDALPAPDTTGLQMPAGAAGGVEDFSDFSDAALGNATDAPSTGKTRAAKPDKASRKPARPRIVNGTAIGLNIGNDSIKVVELQAKGGDIAVTAMGMTHTPAESISNGVVMSVGALQHALRDLFKQAGIKSKRVTISVAGTGALVVRVIEVPRMTDKELDDNMRVDADRYIPFPPSEVIMDYKALRELPSDPDSPNMDVLLAAAQREIIDLHIKVLEEAKLEARAIEVEPLAVSRALTQTVTKQAQALQTSSNGHSNGSPGAGDDVDYSKVSAIINIGAAGTEISVLRGDVLVFTRTVPNGGNALTQALVDYMGLPWHDAERVKREWGDAMPPHVATADTQSTLNGAATDTAGAMGATGGDDWSEFGGFNPAPTVAPASNFAADEVSTILDDDASPPAASSATDPFDPDFFNQGPQNPGTPGQEPREQHGQKEDDPADRPAPAFDFSGFKFSDDDAPAAPAPSAPAPSAPAAETPESNVADEADLSFALADPAPAAPATTTPATADLTPATAASAFSFGDEQVATPAVSTSASGSTADAPDAGNAAPAEAFDLGSFSFGAEESPAAAPASSGVETTPFDLTASRAEPPSNTPVPGATPASTAATDTPPSAWNLDDLGLSDASSQTAGASSAGASSAGASSAGASSAGASSAGASSAGASSAGASTAVTPAATSDFPAFDLPDFEAAPGSTETGATAPAATGDFNLDTFFNTPDSGAAADQIDPNLGFGDAAGALGVGAAGSAAGFDPLSFGDDFGADLTSFGADLTSFGAGLSDDISTGVDAETVYSILHPLLEELANEIRRSLEYHASRYPDAVVQNITLVGGGANFKNVDVFLTQTLGIPTAIGQPLARLSVRAPQLPEGYADANGPMFTVALGLALRDLVA